MRLVSNSGNAETGYLLDEPEEVSDLTFKYISNRLGKFSGLGHQCPPLLHLSFEPQQDLTGRGGGRAGKAGLDQVGGVTEMI